MMECYRKLLPDFPRVRPFLSRHGSPLIFADEKALADIEGLSASHRKVSMLHV
jgi:hypothetical protein